MSVQEFGTEMKAAVEQVKARGTVLIPCDAIIGYLDEALGSGEEEAMEFLITY